MKNVLLLAAACCLLSALTGCLTTDSIVSKSRLGNLQIEVLFPDGAPTPPAGLYVDGSFVGNINPKMPVIYARRGLRTIRVEAAGYTSYEQTIQILGDPNHQFLDVRLEQQ